MQFNLMLLAALVSVVLGADYYEILGVKKTDSTAQIKKAFRGLALKYHPDKNPDKNAEAKFREIVQAYETLVDPDKRREYDQFGATGDDGHHHGGQHQQGGQHFHQQGGGANFDFNEFFRHFDEAFKHAHGGQHAREHMRAHRAAHAENMKRSGFGFDFDDLFADDPFGDLMSDESFYHSNLADIHEQHSVNSRGGQTCKTVTKQVGNTFTQYTTCS